MEFRLVFTATGVYGDSIPIASSVPAATGYAATYPRLAAASCFLNWATRLMTANKAPMVFALGTI
jgi:hypothetical protein